MSLLEAEAPGTAPAPDGEPLRRNRDFLLLWIGAGVSMLGLRAGTVAYPLLVVWQGGSPVAAGLVGFAGVLPQLLVQLPAGVAVDRWDRRRVMIACDLAGVLSMGAVAAMVLAGGLWLPLLMAAAFVEGSAALMYRLAERAAVRNLVRPDQLSAALGQNEARGQAAGLLGGPAGSGLFTLAGWLPFGFTALTHLLALGTLLFIRKDLQEARPAVSRRLRTEVAEGLGWVWEQRFMRAAVVLIAGSNLLFQVLGLALVLTVREHGGSPATIGVIGMVAGIGGVAGALSGPWFMERVSMSVLICGTLAAWTLLVLPVAFTAQPVPLGALFAGMSFAGALVNVVAGVHQVRVTPDALQGRVTSVFALASSGMNAVGALAGGFLLAAWGTGHTVVGVAAAMAVMAVAAVLSPAVRGSGRAARTAAGADTADTAAGADTADSGDSGDSTD
ncbi:MFS transporter [Kitasatospora sp. NPDC093550]|uniref:MFS transporter n=1 Tax=Kitasatospora sp. NPDC093550 TaxID=3364089 RepID=UPI0037FE9FB1